MLGLQKQDGSDAVPHVRGAQAVDRALALLHDIATDSGEGRRLSDLATRTGLDPATARRLICALMRRGFVEQDSWTRKYYLGMQFFSVAAAASNRLDLAASAREALDRLARETGLGGTMMRCEADDLVIVAAVGAGGDAVAFDDKARRPVGADAYGIAVLTGLTAERAEDTVISNITRLPGPAELTVRLIQASLVAARRSGHAIMRAPLTRRISLAVPLRDATGRIVAALGLDDLPAETGSLLPAGGLIGPLLREARGLEEALRRLS